MAVERDAKNAAHFCRPSPLRYVLLRMNEIAQVLADAKSLARKYRKLTGKPLGITGEVAEFSAAQILGLELAEARQSGYDAIRKENGKVIKIRP